MESASSELWSQGLPWTDEFGSRIRSRRSSLLAQEAQDAVMDFDGGHQDTDRKIQVGLDNDTNQPAEPQPGSRTYLRAIHFWDPSADPAVNMDEDTISVVIFQGDLILVHSINENGWTDGTILASGERGWVPTNYCETYDHPLIRPLLSAMSQFWDFLEDDEETGIDLMRQSNTRDLRRGARYLLKRTGCLHRDSTLVQRKGNIRVARRKLRADVSSMIQKASELQEKASQPHDSQTPDTAVEALNDLIYKVFSVVTRAVHFLDVWTQIPSDQLNRSPIPESVAALTSPPDLCSDTMPAATPEPFTQDHQLDVDHVRSGDHIYDEKRSSDSRSHSESRKQPSPLADKVENPCVSREPDFLPNTEPHRSEYTSSPRPMTPEPLIAEHEFCKPFAMFPEKTLALESGFDQREDLRDNLAHVRRSFAWIVFYFTLAMSLSIILSLVWLFAWGRTTDMLGSPLSLSRSPY